MHWRYYLAGFLQAIVVVGFWEWAERRPEVAEGVVVPAPSVAVLLPVSVMLLLRWPWERGTETVDDGDD